LKWKNRMAEYNGGRYPEGVQAPEQEANHYLASEALEAAAPVPSDQLSKAKENRAG